MGRDENVSLTSTASTVDHRVISTILSFSTGRRRIKIKFFNFKTNFDQATQKNYKKANLYGKINFKTCQNYSIHMMPQANCPNLTLKRALISCQSGEDIFGAPFKILYQANETRYIDLEFNLRSLSHSFIFEHNSNDSNDNSEALKCSLECSLEFFLDNAAGKSYSEELVRLVLSVMELKLMKICTVILCIIMISTLKVLVLFTISMGTLFLETSMFIYGWMPAHMVLVIAASFFLINIEPNRG